MPVIPSRSDKVRKHQNTLEGYAMKKNLHDDSKGETNNFVEKVQKTLEGSIPPDQLPFLGRAALPGTKETMMTLNFHVSCLCFPSAPRLMWYWGANPGLYTCWPPTTQATSPPHHLTFWTQICLSIFPRKLSEHSSVLISTIYRRESFSLPTFPKLAGHKTFTSLSWTGVFLLPWHKCNHSLPQYW